MASIDELKQNLTNIAAAIRLRTGETAKFSMDEIAPKIIGINGGVSTIHISGATPNSVVTITNGDYLARATADSNGECDTQFSGTGLFTATDGTHTTAFSVTDYYSAKFLLPDGYQAVRWISGEASGKTSHFNVGNLSCTNAGMECLYAKSSAYGTIKLLDAGSELVIQQGGRAENWTLIRNGVSANTDWIGTEDNLKLENGVFYCQNGSRTLNAFEGENINFGTVKIMCPSNGRLYWMRLYTDGILARDLRPCYRKSDEVPGVYDVVHDVFYPNAGGGAFTVGGDI